jgi:hypothetical protein
MDTPTKVIVCCADHDHATDPACEIKAESVIVPLTADEISAQEAAATQAASDAAARAAAEAATAALKASAKAKLIAGTPLTQEEADVLVL